MDQGMTSGLLTMRQMMKLVRIKSRSTVYKRMKLGQFPQRCSIDLGQSRWRERDVREWIDNLGRSS
jgi:prophage regulatory protein